MQLQAALLPWVTARICSPALSSTWATLGPFQIGTREAEWGADPLERFGGFRNLTYDPNTSFRSALPTNGTALWHQTTLDRVEDTPWNTTKGTVTVGFDNVDWDWIRSVYGWSGIQFQAWARGELEICGSGDAATTVTVSINNVGEFWLDGIRYFGGDFYSFMRAPVVVRLAPGKYALDVRVSYDIRSMGDAMPPMILFTAEVVVTDGKLVAVPEKAVVSDIVEGKIVGEWASIPLRNEDSKWIEVLAVESNNLAEVALSEQDIPIRIAPGQSRPLKLRVKQVEFNLTKLEVAFQYRYEGSDSSNQYLPVSVNLSVIQYSFLPQKYTFLHPSGIVSYAVVRPPSPNASCSPDPQTRAPILLSLHGAAVEADAVQTREEYVDLPDLCAWLLLSSGVTSWSGDDWHVWGFADVEAGIDGLSAWIETVGWARQSIDPEKWVITGHSNGGQGSWYGLTHRNDKIIAAAPLSGYLSIPAYVPYHLWHEADPRITSHIFMSMNTYRHELLTDNMVGTPLLQQHGKGDHNVPTYHSRRMSQLIAESGWLSEYREIPEGHWWDGAMTAGGLPEFLHHYLEKSPIIPDLPNKFSVIVANPADTGPRGGIVVDQLEQPDRIGRIDVEVDSDLWSLETSNIRRFHFERRRSNTTTVPSRVMLDGYYFGLDSTMNRTATFLKSEKKGWTISSITDWKHFERTGRQWGALDAFLSTRGTFQIVMPPEEAAEKYYKTAALEISRNFYQYFAADSEIVNEVQNISGNVVLLGLPSDFGIRKMGESFPISSSGGFMTITTELGQTRKIRMEPGLGAIYLHPLPDERLALVVWGVDKAGLMAAARLVPLRAEVGQPDLVVVSKETSWAGAAGVRAIGMFNSLWQVSAGSYIA